MNKYSLEHLDDKMIFEQAIFRSLSALVPFSCRLTRVDDFELSIELEVSQKVDLLPLHNVLDAAMSVFAAHFWKANSYEFSKMPVTNISFDRTRTISIDIILIRSSGIKIQAEFFVYQGLVNLYGAVLKMQSAKAAKKVPRPKKV
jgi:hypothetical protein